MSLFGMAAAGVQPGKVRGVDWPLTVVLLLIASAGGVMLYSVAGGSWEPWAGDHITRFGITLILMLVLSTIDLKIWFNLAYLVYGLAFLLLVAVELVGDTSLGAQRWLKIGPLRMQPSEIMKVGLVLALARYYQTLPPEKAKFSKELLIPAAMIGLPVLLVAHQPDLGTSILIALTGAAIMVVAGLSLRIIGAAGLIAAIAAPLMYFFVLHDYQKSRVDVLFDPEKDPSGTGYHILQSKIALGSGGLLGQGYGLGSQSQLSFLPEKQTDFIFATLAEEFGFVGCISVLILYATVIFMCLRIATVSYSHFGRLGVAGLTATFSLYVLINGAMVMGLAPVVGIPMPLLSYGGTVMLTVMVGFGFIQSVRVHRYTEVGSGSNSLI